MNIKTIESDKNKFVKWVLQLMTKAKERRNSNVYIVEGIRAIKELAPARIHTLVVTDIELVKKCFDSEVGNMDVVVMSMSILKKVSQDKTPQGILAIVKRIEPDDADKVLEQVGLYLALDNIQDPGNMGTMIRVCDAVGAKALFINKTSVDPYHPKVTKGSMGSIERVPIYVVDDLTKSIELMIRKNISVYGAYLDGSQNHFEYKYPESTCFVIGNEGNGISDTVIDACTSRVRIPMPGGSESLNAGVAASVLLYEALRQQITN